MQIRIGYELIYDCPQSTPMILTLNVHFTRVSDIIVPDHLVADPPVLITAYRDGFGNWCSRIVAPKGQVRLSANAVVKDTGKPDVVAAWAGQTPVQNLPEETLVFLLGSRYCETDQLSEVAWDLFGKSPAGWGRTKWRSPDFSPAPSGACGAGPVAPRREGYPGIPPSNSPGGRSKLLSRWLPLAGAAGLVLAVVCAVAGWVPWRGPDGGGGQVAEGGRAKGQAPLRGQAAGGAPKTANGEGPGKAAAEGGQAKGSPPPHSPPPGGAPQPPKGGGPGDPAGGATE